MRVLALAALVACQRTETAPQTGSGTTPPSTIALGCASAGAIPSAPKVVGPTATGKPDAPVRPISSAAWFPYARSEPVSEDIVAPVAARAKAELTKHLAELDLCMTGKQGSVVAMLEIAPGGAVSARVGGIGHQPTEDCIAAAIRKLSIAGADRSVEVECGLSTRAAGPLRVSTGAGYRRIDVGRDAVRVDGVAQTVEGDRVQAPQPHDDATYLVLADPDVPGAMLGNVMAWLADAPAVLIAVKADGGPPVFLAMGPDRRPVHPPSAPRVQLQIDATKLVACVEQHRESTVSLLEPRTVDRSIKGAIDACSSSCDEVVEVGGASYVAKDLVAATSAVRRAGLDPVMVLGPRCVP